MLLLSISKRFLHVLREKFVEKPNVGINFYKSIHNNSGVTAAWFFENTRYWLLPFTKIYLRIRSIWLFREISKHFVHELVITLEFCQNSWSAVNFSLLWLVEKYDQCTTDKLFFHIGRYRYRPINTIFLSADTDKIPISFF